jgi:hypothetical protein
MKALATSRRLTGLKAVMPGYQGVGPQAWERIREILGPRCVTF